MHLCTKDVGKALKPMQIATKNKLEASVKTQNLLKPMHLCTKAKRKAARNTRILAPGRYIYIYMCVSVTILLYHFAISPANAMVSPQSCKSEVQTCKAKLEKFQHAYKLHIRGVLCVLYS
jgi:hypothetical protein